ncbi:MAG: hypothetical protein [Microviridae sp.]|nr:MAG: hypothetical protein [Microviridae sp.]
METIKEQITRLEIEAKHLEHYYNQMPFFTGIKNWKETKQGEALNSILLDLYEIIDGLKTGRERIYNNIFYDTKIFDITDTTEKYILNRYEFKIEEVIKYYDTATPINEIISSIKADDLRAEIKKREQIYFSTTIEARNKPEWKMYKYITSELQDQIEELEDPEGVKERINYMIKTIKFQ